MRQHYFLTVDVIGLIVFHFVAVLIHIVRLLRSILHILLKGAAKYRKIVFLFLYLILIFLCQIVAQEFPCTVEVLGFCRQGIHPVTCP